MNILSKDNEETLEPTPQQLQERRAVKQFLAQQKVMKRAYKGILPRRSAMALAQSGFRAYNEDIKKISLALTICDHAHIDATYERVSQMTGLKQRRIVALSNPKRAQALSAAANEPDEAVSPTSEALPHAE
jgi:hypothetical protein